MTSAFSGVSVSRSPQRYRHQGCRPSCPSRTSFIWQPKVRMKSFFRGRGGIGGSGGRSGGDVRSGGNAILHGAGRGFIRRCGEEMSILGVCISCAPDIVRTENCLHSSVADCQEYFSVVMPVPISGNPARVKGPTRSNAISPEELTAIVLPSPFRKASPFVHPQQAMTAFLAGVCAPVARRPARPGSEPVPVFESNSRLPP